MYYATSILSIDNVKIYWYIAPMKYQQIFTQGVKNEQYRHTKSITAQAQSFRFCQIYKPKQAGDSCFIKRQQAAQGAILQFY